VDQPTVGILHPGSMGAAVAACAATNAAAVLWCSQGRSTASVARAQKAGLTDVFTLRELLDRSDIVLSLCPPAAAEDLARDVARHSFAGAYVEANAISPERAARVSRLLGPSVTVVDGAVVGSPPVGGKTPTLYLSGPATATAVVEDIFKGTTVRTRVLGEEVGQASALKLSYTAYQKAGRVLAALATGLARQHGVDDELLEIAARRSSSYLTEPAYIPKVAARAWRWGPELEDAADTLAAAGLPPEILRAAAHTLARWYAAKDDTGLTVAEALDRLAEP
jgi:3-hydroxyisobutyrate dehydrogenase-like beta-hydroxyacid dehydrogenase